VLDHFGFDVNDHAAFVRRLESMGIKLDPRDIKYVLISHGHGDHDEGVKILQDLGARIVMSRPDWDLMLNGTSLPGGNPKRDMVAVDGQKLMRALNSRRQSLQPGTEL
jgi:metallo-beta-lactamase class B